MILILMRMNKRRTLSNHKSVKWLGSGWVGLRRTVCFEEGLALDERIAKVLVVILPPPFAGVKWTSTCCSSLRCRCDACAGVRCVAVLVRVASGGQCWPSPSKVARRGKGGPTPVGACPPSAVADADVRTVSSAATSMEMRFGFPSLSPPLPSTYPFLFPQSFLLL